MTIKTPNMIVCPACGYQFKRIELKDGTLKCPKCGHSFAEKIDKPPFDKPNSFTKKKI